MKNNLSYLKFFIEKNRDLRTLNRTVKVFFFYFFTIFNLIIKFDASANVQKDIKKVNFFIDKNLPNFNLFQYPNSSSNTFNVFTHGKPGQLLIDGHWKNVNQIAEFLKPLISKEVSHINIFGCEFGKGEIGKTSVLLLEQKLGLTISASDDITGKDGDWDLEVGKPKKFDNFKDYKYNLQCAKTYTVYTYYRNDPSHCSAVSYRVSGATNTFVTVNQSVPPVGISFEGYTWQKLATNVAPNSVGAIRVTIAADSATFCPNGYILADAILLVDNMGNTYTVDNLEGKPTGIWGLGGASIDYKNTAYVYQKSASGSGHYFDWLFSEAVKILDTDYDGITDVCDVDDDNDGILDSTEGIACGTTKMSDLVGTSLISSPTKTIPLDGYPSGSNVTLTLTGTSTNSTILNYFDVRANPLFAYRDIATGGDGTGLTIDGNFTSNDTYKAIYTFSKPIYNLKFKLADADYGSPNTALPNSELVTINVKLLDGTTLPLDSAKITAYFFKNNNADNGIDSIIKNYKPLISGNTIDGYTSFPHQIYSIDFANCQTQKGIASLEFIWSTKTTNSIRVAQSVFNLQYCGGKDFDGDCIPDYLDVDSDNDGCSDALEGGNTNITVNNIGAYNNIIGGINSTGLPLITPNGQTTGTSLDANQKDPECTPCFKGSILFKDNDNDGIADYCDIDEDNDGILDITECPYITGEYNGSFGIGPLKDTKFCRDLQGNKPSGYRYNCGTLANVSPEATYAVIDQTSSYTWHVNWRNQRGHTTGDPQDAYLAINGALAVGIFYGQEISLGKGIRYNFGLYAANANDGVIEPTEIGIRLVSPTGEVIQNFKTGTLLKENEWVKAGGTFTAQISGTYTLEVYNVYTNAAGNDFSIDDIYFYPLDGCPDYDKDGIADYLDFDSDNDSCPDAIEGAGLVKFNNLNTQTSISGPVHPSGLSKFFPDPIKGQGAGTSIDSTLVGQECINPDYIITDIIKCSTCSTNVVCATADDIPKDRIIGYKTCPLSITNEVLAIGSIETGCYKFKGYDIKYKDSIKTCSIAIGPFGLVDSTYISIPIALTALPFPVNLIQFIGNATTSGITLRWLTINETNFDKFIIEKSVSGNSEYVSLGNVKGGKNDYSFEDTNPVNGLNYYRLKMVNNDGSVLYSNPISVDFKRDFNNLIYPNPVESKTFKLKNTFDLASYQLINSSGKEIPLKYKKTNTDYIFTVIGEIQSGTYLFNYKSESGEMNSKKIIILNE